MRPTSDIAFTPSVKALQTRHGSRAAYARMEARGGFPQDLDEDAIAMISAQRSVFLATASRDGQPYIQHRGGPPGFLHVTGPRTLAFADYRGNKQFISTGNLADNPKIHLFLIDYAHRARIKIWGTATVVEDPAAIAALQLRVADGAVVERAIVIEIEAWNENCPQHIPQRFEAEDVARVLAEKDARIAELERQLATR